MAREPQQPQPRPHQPRGIITTLRSRSFYTYSLAVTVVLLAAIAITLATGADLWPLSFVRTQPITITGATAVPSVDQSAVLHVYVLGDVRVPAAYYAPRRLACA